MCVHLWFWGITNHPLQAALLGQPARTMEWMTYQQPDGSAVTELRKRLQEADVQLASSHASSQKQLEEEQVCMQLYSSAVHH
jgi:hypothetical protein